MAVAETEGSSPGGGHRGLSEWWSEETEYVLQRIERWAAYARGYNRLRSQRLSRGRMTMQNDRGTRCDTSSSQLLLEEPSWGPDRLEAVRGSHRRKPRREEETRLNCCGPFSYQSNSNLDSSCLESYRYDHSIYFKTIGDIKGSGRNPGVRDQNQNPNQDQDRNLDRVSISSEELVEWDIKTLSDSIGEFVMERYLQERKDLEGFDTGTNLEEVEPSSTGPLVDRGTVGGTKQEDESEDLDVGTNSEEPESPSLGPLEGRETDQLAWSATEPREENNNGKGRESEGHDTGTTLDKSEPSERAPVIDSETSQTGLDAEDSKWTTGERGAKVSIVQNNEIQSNNNNSNESTDDDDDDKLTVAIEIPESIIAADTLVEFENYDGNGNSGDGLRWFVGFQGGGGRESLKCKGKENSSNARIVLSRSCCPVLPNSHGRKDSRESSGSQP